MGLFDFFRKKKEKNELQNYFIELAKKNAETSKKNNDRHNDNLNDPEFGLICSKPIYSCGIEGSKIYLSKLKTSEGKTLTWNRTGSVSVQGIDGVVDEYTSYLQNGEIYKKIYINMYSTRISNRTPVGFTLN